MARSNLKEHLSRHSWILWILVWIFMPVLAFTAINTFDLLKANRADVDNVRVDGNTISTTNTNGDLTLDPNGTGGVLFNDMTANRVPYFDANKEIASSSATDTQLGYLANATGNLCGIAQTCTLSNKSIDADANTITNIENADIKAGAAIAVNKLAALTASRAVVSDGSGFLSPSSVTSTELGYLSGVSSAIQTQINNQVGPSDFTAKGDIIGGTGAGAFASLAVGTNGQALVADSSTATGLKWADPTSFPTTTKGDIIVHNGSTNVRQAVGSDGYLLQGDSAASTGVSYIQATDQLVNSTIMKRDSSGNVEAAGIKNTSGQTIWRTDAAAAYSAGGALMIDMTGARPVFWQGLSISNSTLSPALTISTNPSGSNHSWTLPLSQGSAGTVLTNDGSGQLSWSGVSSSSAGSFNYVENPGWEVNSSDWTASGGTYARTTTAAQVGESSGAGSWDSNGASQTLVSDAIAIYAGAYGGNGVASCKFKTASGTATHKIQAYDGTNVLAESTITSSTSAYPRTSVNFIFPSSGNIQLRIISVAADEPAIYIDSCYLGLAEGFNVLEVSQASLFGAGEWAGVTNCTWINSAVGTTFTSFSADTDCNNPTVYGNASAPATKIPGLTFANLPPGDYLIEATGFFFRTGANTAAEFRFTDGTSSSVGGSATYGNDTNVGMGTVVGRIRKTTASSSVTIQLQCKGDGGSVDCGIAPDNSIGSGRNFSISVYRFPTSNELAVRANEGPTWGTLKYAATTNCSWSSTTASMSAFSADTDCPTASVSGSATAPGTKIPGMVVSNIQPGTYKVNVTSGFYAGASTSGAQRCLFEVYDGTSSGGMGRLGENENLGLDYGMSISGLFTYSSVQSSKTFEIRANKEQGNSDCGVYASTADFVMTIEPISQSVAAPILVGSVTSNSSGAERQERAEVNCDASSSITSQSGSWLSAIGNRSGSGCSITIASGMFSSTPACTFTVKATTVQATAVNMTSATAGTVYGAAADFDGYLICMGPR